MKNKCDDYQSEIVHCLWLGRDLFQKDAANYVLAYWSAFEAIVTKIDTHRIRHTATHICLAPPTKNGNQGGIAAWQMPTQRGRSLTEMSTSY